MSFLSYAPVILRRISKVGYYVNRIPTIMRNEKSFSSVTRTIHDVNTNVAKDVILYKYENPKYYMYMNIFAVVQYMFWTYLGLFALQNLRDAPVDRSKITDETPWYRKINLGENKYRNTLGAVSIIIGKYNHFLKNKNLIRSLI